MKNYDEIKRYILDMATRRTGGGSKSETCQYKNGGGNEQYCRMTTNTSCHRCKFYSPSTHAVFTAAYNEVQRAKAAYESNTAIAKRMEHTYRKAGRLLMEMHDMAAEAKADYEKLYIAENSMVTMWQISVNDYE